MNKKNRFVVLILIFIISFLIGFLFSRFNYNNKQNFIIESNTFSISKGTCEQLNTIREEYDKTEDFFDLEEIPAKENLIDIRTQDKFNKFHYENTPNVPIWLAILNPSEFERQLSDINTDFICFIDGTQIWSESHKVCYRYLGNLLYLFYNRTEVKINTIPTKDSGLANEWEYYQLEDHLNKDEEYIVFYEELNLDNFNVIDLNKVDDIHYLKNKIYPDKIYNIICTNDFSCLHSWAIKEKLKTLGFDNIQEIIKFINFDMIKKRSYG